MTANPLQSHAADVGRPMAKRYRVGVMKVLVESNGDGRFDRIVETALGSFRETLTNTLAIDASLFSFRGPHLTPKSGGYEAMDFLRIGLNEKIERQIDFLLVITEVDLLASTLAYAVAMPSQLTNVAIISTKRLDPEFWGREASDRSPPQRLSSLMLHSFGHLLGLSHDDDRHNVMFDFKAVDELDNMVEFSDRQRQTVAHNLPIEARERVSKRSAGRVNFMARAVAVNAAGIVAGVCRANPLRLVGRLPTLITAALSVLIFLLFTPDMWDVASVVDSYQMVLFAMLSIAGASVALYRSFASGPISGRDRVLAESSVVTEAVVILSVSSTMLLLFAIFAGLLYLAIASIFPQTLMRTWTTVVPATGFGQHIKLCLFVAGLSILAGSLGGRADSRELVRGVLFTDEET